MKFIVCFDVNNKNTQNEEKSFYHLLCFLNKEDKQNFISIKTGQNLFIDSKMRNSSLKVQFFEDYKFKRSLKN